MFSTLRSHRRIQVLAIITMAFLAVFAVRLFQLQVLDHDKYVALASEEQRNRFTIPAQRGELYMMDGNSPVKIALNETVYTMFVDPTVVKDKAAVLTTIREVAGGNTVKDFASKLDKTDTQYQVVANNVTRRQAELVKKRQLAGVGFQAVSRRVYPEGTLASQTLGFVNAEGKGQYGIEGTFHDELKGKNGALEAVTDVSNVPLTIGENNVNIPAKNGDNIVLTLDRNVQSYAEQALQNGLKQAGAKYGSVIVLDPNSGHVKAMANYPSFHPAKFTKVLDPQAFNNGTISSPYEPGSVMKAFTVATGIDTGTVTPSSTYVNTDSIRVEDRTITNASKGQTGTITMQHALNWSLNTGMVTIAQRLGDGAINDKSRRTMYRYLHDKFRLGQNTGIELTGEASGQIIPPTETEGNAVRYSNMSFGQGMDLTMLQVASGFGTIVNGGTYYQPTVLRGVVNEEGNLQTNSQRTIYRGVISETSSKQARKMIVNARRAFYADGDRKGYAIGGKTGTSQTLKNGKYNTDETIATYLGFGGDSKPQYVIMVKVSSPGRNLKGDAHAMPIFTDISNWMIDYLTLQPKG